MDQNSSGSEFLGMDQRVQEVDAETDSDNQSDDGLDHGLSSSQSIASDGVDAHQDKKQNSDDEIDNVGHGASLLCDAGVCALDLQAINMGKGPSL